MAEPLEQYVFEQFVHNLKRIDFIIDELDLVETNIATIDQHIEEADRTGLDEIVEQLSAKRNDLNLKRIDLEIQKNKIERQLLEFERAQALSK